MQSMTGYGRGIAEADGKKVTAELKTVNHRSLDWGLKLPRAFLFLEDAIKKQIASVVTRGHVDVFVNFEQSSASLGGYKVDEALAKQYLDLAAHVSLEYSLPNDLTVSSILRNQDIVTRESESDDDEALTALTEKALGEALAALKEARGKEGEHLKADLSAKLDNMQKSLDVIKELSPVVVETYRAKLTERIGEAVKGVVDETRLATEVALFADKCCIDEEITRLGAHIALMRKTLEQKVPVGRDLDFRVQEMNRETNTIGSKANDLRITAEVLRLKNEIEKIREQAANVE